MIVIARTIDRVSLAVSNELIIDTKETLRCQHESRQKISNKRQISVSMQRRCNHVSSRGSRSRAISVEVSRRSRRRVPGAEQHRTRCLIYKKAGVASVRVSCAPAPRPLRHTRHCREPAKSKASLADSCPRRCQFGTRVCASGRPSSETARRRSRVVPVRMCGNADRQCARWSFGAALPLRGRVDGTATRSR